MELIQENGSCRVQELSALFKVSEPTIRQDLKVLEETGAITRQHGGAYLNKVVGNTIDITLPDRGHNGEKERIGAKAAELVCNGDNIILDSGSTVTAMAAHMGRKTDLNVVTNAINIALTLAQEPSNNIMLIGGEFKAPTLSLTGNRGLSILQNLHANKLFLATGAFNPEIGLSYPSFSDLDIKRAMIGCADTVYLLADSSKLGKTLFASLGELDQIDYLVTDSGIDDEMRKRVEDLGIRLVVC